MHGLVEYDGDSQSDSEHHRSQPGPARSSEHNGNDNATNDKDKQLKSASSNLTDSEPRRTTKSQIVIRKPPQLAHNQKSKARAHVSLAAEEAEGGSGDGTSQVRHYEMEQDKYESESEAMELSTPPSQSHPSPSHRREDQEPKDELSRIRALIRPPEIMGIDDWGIPPPSDDPPDPALSTKLAHFQTLKRDTDHPQHFNDSLMSNRSFRNPHLYTKLVEFVDVDERATNFPPHIWNPNDVQQDWFADQIAEYQKSRSEQQAAAQSSGKRSQINFAPSSHNPKAKEKERETGLGTAVGRKSRFQPYGAEFGASDGRKGRGRWG